jgi:hypothetical protein
MVGYVIEDPYKTTSRFIIRHLINTVKLSVVDSVVFFKSSPSGLYLRGYSVDHVVFHLGLLGQLLSYNLGIRYV